MHCGVVRHKRGQKLIEVMSFRHGEAPLFHQAFQVFLGTLLAMEANTVMDWDLALPDLAGEYVILLGLFDPLPGRLFHKGFCPWKRLSS